MSEAKEVRVFNKGQANIMASKLIKAGSSAIVSEEEASKLCKLYPHISLLEEVSSSFNKGEIDKARKEAVEAKTELEKAKAELEALKASLKKEEPKKEEVKKKK
jgi:hypothetical protein